MGLTATLSIVIVNYNAREHLENCCARLRPPRRRRRTRSWSSQRLDRRQRRGASRAMAGCDAYEHASTGDSAGQQHRIQATRGDLSAAQQRHARPPRRDRRAGHPARGAPAAAVAGPRLIECAGPPELSFGPMISPLGDLRQKLTTSLYDRRRGRRAMGGRATTRGTTRWSAARAARAAARRGGGGLLDDELHVHRGRRFLRGDPRAGGACPVHACREVVHLRGRSRATVRRRRTSPTAAATSPSTRSTPALGAGPRAYLRIKGQFPR